MFSISGNRGNTWHSASVPLDSRGNPFFIIFQAVRGSRYSSDVAVDDVHFVGCTGQPGTVNFGYSDISLGEGGGMRSLYNQFAAILGVWPCFKG